MMSRSVIPPVTRAASLKKSKKLNEILVHLLWRDT